VVEVYKNGAKVGTVPVAAYASLGGRIGVSVAKASTARFDNFGGGTVTQGAVATAAQASVPELETAAPSAASGPLWLSAAFPNPTRGGVALTLGLPRTSEVEWSVLDVQGREIWRDPPVERGPGTSALTWDGRSRTGPTTTGLYFVRVRVGDTTFLRRLALVR
jgi:hypothetical protein